MPGPVSDSYDPEWGTGANAAEISEALDAVYKRLTKILGGQPPMYILDLVRSEFRNLNYQIPASLTAKEWRLLRFAVERARDSI